MSRSFRERERGHFDRERGSYGEEAAIRRGTEEKKLEGALFVSLFPFEDYYHTMYWRYTKQHTAQLRIRRIGQSVYGAGGGSMDEWSFKHTNGG